MPSSTWSKKTYELVADILAETFNKPTYVGGFLHKPPQVDVFTLVQAFCLEFQIDNPEFDANRFRKAATEKLIKDGVWL
jgi:hypothetical protein